MTSWVVFTVFSLYQLQQLQNSQARYDVCRPKPGYTANGALVTQYITKLSMQYPPVACYSVRLSSQYLPQNRILITLRLSFP
jgi:hypothetical protein